MLATVGTDSNRTASRFASTLPPESEKPEPEPRQDIAMLYSFIGLLFAAQPEERALQFWGSEPQQGSFRPTYQESVESISGRLPLPAFLQWAVWSTSVQDLTVLVVLYDMLSGLENGQQCSDLAYNFMARGGGRFSWKYGVVNLRSFRVVDHHFWTLGFMGSQRDEPTQPTSASTSRTDCTFRLLLPKIGSI